MANGVEARFHWARARGVARETPLAPPPGAWSGLSLKMAYLAGAYVRMQDAPSAVGSTVGRDAAEVDRWRSLTGGCGTRHLRRECGS